MEYCRRLDFKEEPDYRTCIGFFTGCLARHNLDPKVFDYTWKQNRLAKEKENLKASLAKLIQKKPNKQDNRDYNNRDQAQGMNVDQTANGVGGTTYPARASGAKALQPRGSAFKNAG